MSTSPKRWEVVAELPRVLATLAKALKQTDSRSGFLVTAH